MAVDFVPLDATIYPLEGVRAVTSLPETRWFMARDTAGNIVLVQWDLGRNLLSFDFAGGHVTIAGG